MAQHLELPAEMQLSSASQVVGVARCSEPESPCFMHGLVVHDSIVCLLSQGKAVASEL